MNERHPGGRTCDPTMLLLALILFIPLCIRGLWRDRHNLGEVWKEMTEWPEHTSTRS
jgi:hypothetical protein